ncbi:MAG: TIM44-like domain-containing protein [Tenericutes bacterium]|nr:TIM44-like domain-containing protein [Mycoplasmatota bacterium]
MKKSFLNKIILVVVLTLSVAATLLYANPVDVATDSGFDTSYDSGGSYSSSSSSSYSHSSSSSYNHSSSSSASAGEIFLGVIGVLCIWLIEVGISNLRAKIQDKHDKKQLEKRKNEFNSLYKINKKVSEDEFSKYIKKESMADFVFERFKDYVDIQNAWMEFDYDVLSNKTTNELYNQYLMQLETLKAKGQKNVMNSFTYVKGKVTNIEKTDNQLAVTVEIVTRFYDYIINQKDEKILRGADYKKVTLHYQMTFVKSTKKSITTHCPNCGAELKKTSTNVCEFCKTTITKESDEWLLAEKKSLGQI